MAALAGDLSKAILGQSDAAKAFRPWWDTVEDGLMYAFVIMSLVTLPMTFLSGNPVDCAIHRQYWYINNSKVPHYTRFIQNYAKRYCTETNLSMFLLYLPFTLLLAPLLLTAIDKFFIKIFRCENKLDQFYSLLVKESLSTEDVGSLETDNIKDLHEIRQAFRNSSGCYKSYLYRTVSELLCVLCVLFLYIQHSNIYGILNPFFNCDVHGTNFECVIPNSKFFFIIFCLSVSCLLGYTVCTGYNLAWILMPRLNKLRTLLKHYKAKHRHMIDSQHHDTDIGRRRDSAGRHSELGSTNNLVAGRLEMYFDKKSRDFSLLMDLLAESSGLVQSLRILSMFDRQFRQLWIPKDIHLSKIDGFAMIKSEEEEKTVSIRVTWDDCMFADDVHKYLGGSILEYTVEIQPQTEASIKSLQYYRLEETADQLDVDVKPSENGDVTMTLFGIKDKLDQSEDLYRSKKYSVRFDGLSCGKDYKIFLSTEIDGQTVTQAISTFSSEKSTDAEKSKEETQCDEPSKENSENLVKTV